MRLIICPKDFDWAHCCDDPEMRQKWLSFSIDEYDPESVFAISVAEGSRYGLLVETSEGVIQTTYDNFDPDEPDAVRWFDGENWKSLETLDFETAQVEIHAPKGSLLRFNDEELPHSCISPDEGLLEEYLEENYPCKAILTNF